MSKATTRLEPRLHVICLCAQWCGTCRDYASRFEQIEKDFPQVRFSWIDIEDESDLVDPIEVEDFPAFVLVDDKGNDFFVNACAHCVPAKT